MHCLSNAPCFGWNITCNSKADAAARPFQNGNGQSSNTTGPANAQPSFHLLKGLLKTAGWCRAMVKLKNIFDNDRIETMSKKYVIQHWKFHRPDFPG